MSHWKLLKILQRKHMKIRNFGKRNGKETNPPFLDRYGWWDIKKQLLARKLVTNMLHPEKSAVFEIRKKSSVHHPPWWLWVPSFGVFVSFSGSHQVPSFPGASWASPTTFPYIAQEVPTERNKKGISAELGRIPFGWKLGWINGFFGSVGYFTYLWMGDSLGL